MKKILIPLSILTVVLYGCKDEDVINNPDLISTQASRDHLIAEVIFNDVERVVEDAFIDNGESKSCPTYTLKNSNITDKDTMIIDFGNGNPVCISYGNIKSGKIEVIYTGKYRDSLSVITATFDNYHVNNNSVQGERIVTNQGRDIVSKNMWFTIEVNDASIGTNNGAINWESERVREWVEGSTTFFNIFDDKYKITGTASGNAVNGNAFTMEITDTLNVDFGCLPSCVIKSGEVKISPNGYTDRIINYGDSLCDCNFDVTINGTTYLIVIN